MRWTIQAMLLAVAIVASACGVYRAFWDGQRTNHSLLLGAFILLTCVAVVAAALGSRMRGAFAGAGLFGVVHLVCVLRGGFGLETIYDSQRLAHDVYIGFALFGISFLASQLVVMLTKPGRDATKDRPEAQ